MLYYKRTFNLYQNDVKKTWTLIKETLQQKKKQELPAEFIWNDQIITDLDEIANKFNTYFINIGHSLSEQIHAKDRLLTLENKVESMNIKVESNTSAIKAIERNMAALNAMDKNKDSVIQLDQRIKLVENKLSEQSAIAQVNNNIHNTNDRKPTNETTCGKIVVAENAIVIHNLAYRQRDVEDVNKMMSRGLNLGIKAKTIHRAPSRYNNAGVLTVEMHSLDDKAAVLKRRAILTNNNQLNNVVIKSFKTPTHVQIENKFDSLINAMHMKVFNRDRSAYNRINGFRPYTKGY